LINITSYRAVVFDLDNTVYNEIEYLTKVFEYISLKLKIEEVSSFLLDEFSKNGRNNLYQKLVKNFHLKNFTIHDFLNCYRNCPVEENEIKINPSIYGIIEELYRNKRMIFILTNGNIIQQKNKIKSIDLPHKKFINIFYASSKGKKFQKPNPFFINKILLKNSINYNEILFIGDSQVDKQTAINSNIDFKYIHEII